MPRFRVQIVQEAEEDLAEIVRYIADSDSAEHASYVLDQLLSLCNELEQHPARGHFPPEFSGVGIKAYREVHFKPYRVIYEITERIVYVHLIIDGRRSIETLLERRLLR